MNSQRAAQAKRDKLFVDNPNKSPKEEILRFIEWVTLAPSTHNTQPWRFEVVNETKITVAIEKRKAVTNADPDFRDMFISVGTLIRHIEIIGDELDCVSDMSIEPTFEKDEVATFIFNPSKKWKEFLDSNKAKDIAGRQNYRGKYSTKRIEVKTADEVASHAVTETGRQSKVGFHAYNITSQQAQRLSDFIALGIADAYKIPEFRAEVAAHMNSNFSKNETGLHGYSLTLNSFLSAVLPTVMRKKDIGKKLSALNLKGIQDSQGIFVMFTEGDAPTDWVDAGRAMLELFLELKAIGVQTSIYAAAIEVGAIRDKVNKSMLEKNQFAQLMFTYGYPAETIGFSHRQSPASITTFR